LVNSLLTAIVRADGDALVMHVGERPYVVAPAGPVELSARPLTLEAVAGMLGQLLPADSRRTLEELGAVEHSWSTSAETYGERFTVVAARGGDDIWIEIRRHRNVPTDVEPAKPAEPVLDVEAARPAPAPPVAVTRAPVVESASPAFPLLGPPGRPSAPAPAMAVPPAVRPLRAEPIPPPPSPKQPLRIERLPETITETAAPVPPELPVARPSAVAERPRAAIERHVERGAPGADRQAAPNEPRAAAPERPVPELKRPAPAPQRSAPAPGAEQVPAVVLPLARNPVRAEAGGRALSPPRIAGLDRLLRLAAARGANTLYLMAQARPSVRVDGEIAALDGEAVLTAPEVESLLLDLAPERNREALRNGEGTEWMSEVPEVGRIRCQSFRDHRGPGGIFRMISTRPTSAEQLGLSREIQSLCAEPEGLVLVAGPRSSGKSTLISAFVDLINRTRNDYVITIESLIKCAHESRGCLVSQREVRGNAEEVATVVRAALRENPDILVIEDLRSPEVIALALEAMEAGHLVIGAVAAHTATTAIGRILDQFPPERRDQVQLMLAEGLRGIVSQVLLHKTSGGRIAARELLINTPSISNLIAEGRISQLPLALDNGRKHGMVPLNDALAAFVQSGIVDVKDAYRKAYERQAFLAVLRREGVDTSFVERLA
jgi:twitching motility protein PilT